MGSYLVVLCESYPMNTIMAEFRWFSKIPCVLVLWTKVASALEALNINQIECLYIPITLKTCLLIFKCMHRCAPLYFSALLGKQANTRT